jgi:hypothetical protein
MAILSYIVSFSLFVVLQSLAINGIKYSMQKGMILENFGLWMKDKLGDYWFKPFGGCVVCMASVWGTITFWISILPIYRFNIYELWVWIMDVFILVSVNSIIYKKV